MMIEFLRLNFFYINFLWNRRYRLGSVEVGVLERHWIEMLHGLAGYVSAKICPSLPWVPSTNILDPSPIF